VAFEDSLTTLERCIALDPNHVEAMVTLADSIVEEDPDQAVSLYRRAIQTSKRPLPNVHFALACALQTKGTKESISQATDEFQRVIKQQLCTKKQTSSSPPRALAHLHLGMIHDTSGNFQAAICEYDLAIQINNPKETCIPLIIACRCNSLHNDNAKAIEYCKKVLQRRPYNCKANWLLAELCHQRLSIVPNPVNDEDAKSYLGCVLRLKASLAEKKDIQHCQRHL
jgi:tetratricopeptide (TPR) repeat protein